MQGERGSVFKSIFLNPMVWIGVLLTVFTLQNEDEKNVFQLFLNPTVYRNLALGCAVYVGLFDRHYTHKMKHLDIPETLMAVLQAMLTILLVWVATLGFIVSYHTGGESYSEALKDRYRQAGYISKEEAKPENIQRVLKELNFDMSKSYKITPQSDGTVWIEVIDNESNY